MTIDEVAEFRGVNWEVILMEFWHHVERQRQRGVAGTMQEELTKWVESDELP